MRTLVRRSRDLCDGVGEPATVAGRGSSELHDGQVGVGGVLAKGEFEEDALSFARLAQPCSRP